MLANYIHIGHIAKTHGLDGCVSIKIIGTTQFAILCSNIKYIYLSDNMNPLSIVWSKLNSKVFLKTKLKEITNREQAKKLLRQTIYIKKGEVEKIDQLHNKYVELVGFQVVDNNKNTIGFIETIDYNRIQPLITIKNDSSQFMAPYISDFIINIDKQKKIIFTQFPTGLIETCKI